MRLRLVVLVAAVLFCVPGTPALGQQPAEAARARALCDFHGPDGVGKDGPLSKAGFDLLLLYHRARLHPDSSSLPHPPSGLQLRAGHVAIDAIAASAPDRLRQALDSLGLQDGSQAGRVVSGWLPINRIPALARLSSLRGVQPARAQARSSEPGPPSRPSPLVPDSARSPD